MAFLKESNPILMPFSKAVKIEKLDSQTYRANLSESYLIGLVPNGGYVGSCLLRAAMDHLAPRGQPHPMTAHFEYFTRTEAGPAIIVIEDVKSGRQFSTLHLTLYQSALLPHAPWISPGASRREVAAYITMNNLPAETGLSLPTGWALPHPPPATPDFAALRADSDPSWTAFRHMAGSPIAHLVCLKNLQYFVPRRGHPQLGVFDLWIRMASGEGFTTEALGFVADCLPYPVEAYRPAAGEEGGPFAHGDVFWYPTVVMNVEVKRALPEAGVEWLRMRIQPKVIQGGRFDLEVVIFDEAGRVVALSQHVNLIVGLERNTAKRGGSHI
ncbi:thioesterase-like superfamily-domain-containing protein [Lasiosphaeris hirsuta]|uniref:Thioesterase-like superfamily-domain-containing protein n=1 Tax=Lasiosphaeris hirsuta TaxID=260670 RepID=A0AA40AHT0_9PEZI|nr:thioesterase-like superfamily-domain-containing protein [Lasiosphaeris hirsuta]